jgi:hypothetical protein
MDVSLHEQEFSQKLMTRAAFGKEGYIFVPRRDVSRRM